MEHHTAERIDAAGWEAAEAADSEARARVEQLMTERISAELATTGLSVRVVYAARRLIIGWFGDPVPAYTPRESAASDEADEKRAALVRELTKRGYTVTSDTHAVSDSGHGRGRVRHGAAIAVEIRRS